MIKCPHGHASCEAVQWCSHRGVGIVDQWRIDLRHILNDLDSGVITGREAFGLIDKAGWDFAERMHGERFVILG